MFACLLTGFTYNKTRTFFWAVEHALKIVSDDSSWRTQFVDLSKTKATHIFSTPGVAFAFVAILSTATATHIRPPIFKRGMNKR